MTIHTRLSRRQPLQDGLVSYVVDVTGYDADAAYAPTIDHAYAEDERRLELLEDLVKGIGTALIPYLASTRIADEKIEVVLRSDPEAEDVLRRAYNDTKAKVLSFHRRRRAQALKA